MKRLLTIFILLVGLIINSSMPVVFPMDISSDQVSFEVQGDQESSAESSEALIAATSVGGALEFQCSWQGCSEEIMGIENLITHFGNHTKQAPFICLYRQKRLEQKSCEKQFSTQKDLLGHIKSVHYAQKINAQLQCPFCPQSTKRDLPLSFQHFTDKHSDRITIGSGKMTWQCIDSQCQQKKSNTGRNLIGLLDHVNSHKRRVLEASPVLLRCCWQDDDETPKCTMEYADKNHLKKHIEEAHIEGNSFFVCKFSSRNGVCNNSKSQTKEKLLSHIMKVHISNQEEKMCPFCSQKAVTFSHIKSEHANENITIVENGRHWICTQSDCPGEGGTIGGLLSHIKARVETHSQGAFKCRWDGCSSAFKEMCFLKQHSVTEHINFRSDGTETANITCLWRKTRFDGTGQVCCEKKGSRYMIFQHFLNAHLSERCPVCKNREGYLNVKFTFEHVLNHHGATKKANSNEEISYSFSDGPVFKYKKSSLLENIKCFDDIKKYISSVGSSKIHEASKVHPVEGVSDLSCRWEGCSCGETFENKKAVIDHIFEIELQEAMGASLKRQIQCKILNDNDIVCGHNVVAAEIRNHIGSHYHRGHLYNAIELKCPYPLCMGHDFQKQHIIDCHSDDYLVVGKNSTEIKDFFPRIICKVCAVPKLFRSLFEVHHHICQHLGRNDYRMPLFVCQWNRDCRQEFFDRESAIVHLEDHAQTSNFCKLPLAHNHVNSDRPRGSYCSGSLLENPRQHFEGHSSFLKGDTSICLLCLSALQPRDGDEQVRVKISANHILDYHKGVIMTSYQGKAPYFSCMRCQGSKVLLGTKVWDVMAHILKFHPELVKCNEGQKRILHREEQPVDGSPDALSEESVDSVDQMDSPDVPVETIQNINGLENRDNRCYLNATVQCLASLAQFNTAANNQIRINYSVLANDLLNSQNNSQAHNDFHHQILLDNQWQQGTQQDAAEFYTQLVPNLFLSTGTQATTDRIVHSLIQSTVSHMACDGQTHTSTQGNPEALLALEIPRGARALNICLNNYFAPEQLNGSNQFNCATCGKNVDATKKLSLASFPEVLTIQLKRFGHAGNGGQGVKNETPVAFPMTLKTNPQWADQEGLTRSYKLVGFVVHSGAINAGHYWAYTNRNGQWLYCNDTTVEERDESNIGAIAKKGLDGEGTPYMLFYQKIENQLQEDRAGSQKRKMRSRIIESDDDDEEEEVDHAKRSKKDDEQALISAQGLSKQNQLFSAGKFARSARNEVMCLICNREPSYTMKKHILYQHAYECFVCKPTDCSKEGIDGKLLPEAYEGHIRENHRDYCYICFNKHSGSLIRHIEYRHPEKIQEHIEYVKALSPMAATTEDEPAVEPQQAAKPVEQEEPKKKMSLQEYLNKRRREKEERENR